MNPPVLHFHREQLSGPDGSRTEWPLLGLLGDPVAHSLSPRMHEEALRGLGIVGQYRAILVAPGELEEALAHAWREDVRGLQLTLPHKEAVLRCVPRHSAEVLGLGAANTLRRCQEGWEAHNTDLPGLIHALEECFPDKPWKGPSAVLGSGGAARACLAALEELGSGPRRVLARRPQRAAWATERGAQVMQLETAELGDLSLVLQATSLGLSPEDPSPIPPASLPEGCAVMDLCYGPQLPRLLREHRGRGPIADGRAMLIAQAELAFRLWFPELDPRHYLVSALVD